MRIVLVCDANRARSPIAAALLERELDRRGMSVGIGVSSAGLNTRGGQPAVPEAVEAAAGLGLDIAAHRSRPLVEDDLGADLIITMTRSQLDAIAPRRAGLGARTFTLVELVALLALADLRGNQRRADEEAADWGTAVARGAAGTTRDGTTASASSRPAGDGVWRDDPAPLEAPLLEPSRAAIAGARAIRLGIDVANGQRSRRRSAVASDDRAPLPGHDDVVDPMRGVEGEDPSGLELAARLDATVTELERLMARLARLLVGPAPRRTPPAPDAAPDPGPGPGPAA